MQRLRRHLYLAVAPMLAMACSTGAFALDEKRAVQTVMNTA
jgi:hypothetical protein